RAADNAVRAMASGATFGMADELAALGRTATGQGTYAQNVAEERKRDEAIPSLVRIPGEIAGGVMTGTGLARGGLSLLNAARPTLGSMVGRGAGEGAIYGAAHGVGSGEGLQNRLEEAAYGATLGGATGAALGGVGAKMARSGMRRTIPDTNTLKAQSNAAYRAADEAGVVVHRGKVSDAIDDIVSMARSEGLDPDIHK